MKYLDELRKKPLAERKRIAWIGAGSVVVIILLVSIFLTKDWSFSSLNIANNSDLRELGEKTQNLSTEIQSSIAEYESAKEKAKTSEEAELAAELEIPTKIKNDVAVSFLKWEIRDGQGIALWLVKNDTTKEVILEDFYLHQGITGVSSNRTVSVAPEQEKEFEILFPLTEETATGLEIRKVYFSESEENSESAVSEWSYLFVINPEPSPEEKQDDDDTITEENLINIDSN